MDPRSMLARILGLLVAAGILVLAFFFMVAAIVAGVVIAAALLGRLWWVSRKLRKAAQAQIVTTEYRVIGRERLEEPLLAETAEDPTSVRHSREDGSPGNDTQAPKLPPSRE